MEKNSKIMLGAALVVALLALAGAGYAASDYYAKTTNTDNSMDTTYIELTQTAGSASAYGENFLKNLKFNTENVDNASTISYIPVFTHAKTTGTPNTYASGESNDYALIGEGLTLSATRNNVTGNAVTMDVTVSNFVYSDQFEYIMVLGTLTAGTISETDVSTMLPADVNTTAKTGTWHFNSLALNASGATEWGVFLFVKLTGDSSNTANVGFATSADASKSDFTFTLNHTTA